jgi:hypothetical protein
MKSTIFWDITSCSPLKVNRRYEGTYRLHLQGKSKKWAWMQVTSRASLLVTWFVLVSCFAYSTTSVTPVDFQRTTSCYIPEDSTLHIHFALLWLALQCETLMAVNAKVMVFWNVTLCNAVDICQSWGEIYFFRVEDGECRWYWNVGTYVPKYTAPHLGRPRSYLYYLIIILVCYEMLHRAPDFDRSFATK